MNFDNPFHDVLNEPLTKMEILKVNSKLVE